MPSWQQKYVRQASRAVLGGFRPSDSSTTSWFGRVLVGLPGETWPVSNGKPMMPLAQFNVNEAPYRPDRLADVALLTVFLDEDQPPSDTPNGEGWALRAYSSLQGLVPLERPAGAKWGIKAMPILWELLKKDYPCADDLENLEPPADWEDNWGDRYDNLSGTKLGGWPTLIQSEIFWAPNNEHPANPEFVFQIDSEEKAKWNLGDCGICYFGRGTGESSDDWTFAWQCM